MLWALLGGHRNDVPNAPMLGAMAAAGLVNLEAVTTTILKKFGAKGPANADAARRPMQKHVVTEKRYLLGPVGVTFAAAKTGSWRVERPVQDPEKCSACACALSTVRPACWRLTRPITTLP